MKTDTNELRRRAKRLTVETANCMNQAADELELLRWRVETAIKASCLQHIDSPQETMGMILRGDYDNNREEALRDDQYAE